MLSERYPIDVLCAVAGCSRSSYYYQGQAVDEGELRAAVEAVALQWPTYGSRRITAELRRQGRCINRKQVRRLMSDMGLQVKVKRSVMPTNIVNSPMFTICSSLRACRA